MVAREGQWLLLQPSLISAVHMPEFVCWRGCGGDGVGFTCKRNRGFGVSNKRNGGFGVSKRHFWCSNVFEWERNIG